MVTARVGAPLAALAILAVAATPALAHVEVVPSSAPAGEPLVFEVSIPHGCDGSPTTGLRLRLPDGVAEATALPDDGWTATVAPGDDGALVATWTGGSIPDAEVGTFALEMALPDQPGTLVHLPAIQLCADGRTRWIQVPGDGEDASSLDLPAPAIEVLEPEREPSGTATAERHDEPTATEATVSAAEATTAEVDPPAEEEPPATTAPAAPDDGGRNGVLPYAIAGAIGGGAVVGGIALARRRR